MSIRRLLATVAVMAGIAAVLGVLTPEPATMARAVAAAQRTVDTQGPDALISAAAGLLAWAVWTWGALGLALTAASALPGLAGRVAGLALRGALPAGAGPGAPRPPRLRPRATPPGPPPVPPGRPPLPPAAPPPA